AAEPRPGPLVTAPQAAGRARNGPADGPAQHRQHPAGRLLEDAPELAALPGAGEVGQRIGPRAQQVADEPVELLLGADLQQLRGQLQLRGLGGLLVLVFGPVLVQPELVLVGRLVLAFASELEIALVLLLVRRRPRGVLERHLVDIVHPSPPAGSGSGSVASGSCNFRATPRGARDLGRCRRAPKRPSPRPAPPFAPRSPLPDPAEAPYVPGRAPFGPRQRGQAGRRPACRERPSTAAFIAPGWPTDWNGLPAGSVAAHRDGGRGDHCRRDHHRLAGLTRRPGPRSG